MNSVIETASILIFEPDENTLQQLSEILTSQNCTVTSVHTFDAVLASVDTQLPALILLNLNHSEFQGFELCQQLKVNPKTASIPIITITDIQNRDVQMKGFSVGASDYITFPFAAEEVLARIKVYLHLYQLNQARIASNSSHLKSNLSLNPNQVVELVQREKNIILTSLVSSVVHDINNPLGCITGNLNYVKDYIKDLLGLIELYQDSYPDPVAEITEEIETIDLEYLTEDLPNILSAMENAGERLRQISQSLRTLGRFESDRKVNFNVHEGLETAILVIKSRLKGNKNRSQIDINKDYGNLPEIFCYPGELTQVFLNLINNAIEALDEKAEKQPSDSNSKPTITIKTELNTAETAGVKIMIQDNGLGIPEQIQNQIYEGLFTTKSPERNSGIGLSISRKIIEEKHQGHLHTHSTPEGKTEFIIELPME